MTRRAPRFILECIKTGRFWRFDTEALAEQAAHRFGLQDYTIGRDE